MKIKISKIKVFVFSLGKYYYTQGGTGSGLSTELCLAYINRSPKLTVPSAQQICKLQNKNMVKCCTGQGPNKNCPFNTQLLMLQKLPNRIMTLTCCRNNYTFADEDFKKLFHSNKNVVVQNQFVSNICLALLISHVGYVLTDDM